MARPTLTGPAATLISVSVIIASWALAVPRYAGPDEPSHAIASAALVRGERGGTPVEQPVAGSQFDVPSMVGDPDPGCFAFQTDVTAACTGPPVDSTALGHRVTTANQYPIWGHVLPGLASFLPSPTWYLYVARILNGLLGIALVGTAIGRCVRTSNKALLLGMVVGLTPIAWFAMSVVNPSATTIAGGVALWTAMLTERRVRGDVLMLAGWLAVLFPRRDGPIWATLIVLAACLVERKLPTDFWSRWRSSEKVVFVATLPLLALPVFMNYYDRFAIALACAPLAIALLEAGGRALRNRGIAHRPSPIFVVIIAVVAVGVSLALVNVIRPGGVSTPITWAIVNGTGDQLRQMVGILGWLDAPVPQSSVLLWWVLLGAIAALAYSRSPRAAGASVEVLAAAVVAAWLLQLGTSGAVGPYWQARYSLPLLIGIPMVLGRSASDLVTDDRRLVHIVAGSVWWIWNTGFYGAMRRWGAGLEGSNYPWRWDSWSNPVPISLLLITHALASAWLIWNCTTRAASASPAE